MSERDAREQDVQWISLARIGAPHGVKGWVKLHSYTQPRDNIRAYRDFLVRRADRAGQPEESGPLALELDEIRPLGKSLIAHVVGYDAPEQSRTLTGLELGVDRRQLPELEAGEYYWHELQGLKVSTLDGRILGRVASLIETGANDVLVVEPDEDSIDDEQRLIPWVPEQYIMEVDLEAGSLQVDWEPDWLQD